MNFIEKEVQKQTAAQENLATYNQDIESQKEYLDKLREEVQKNQNVACQSTKILELNNFTKNSFNTNSKECRVLLGLIYGYLQQIGENLNTICQKEDSLNELCKENQERIDKIDANFDNALKALEIMNKHIEEKNGDEAEEIKRKINEVDEEIKECEEKCENLVEEYEEKRKQTQNLEVENDILQDNIEKETQKRVRMIEEHNEGYVKILDEIKAEMELRDKVLQTEKRLLVLSQELKEKLDNKEGFLKKGKELEEKLGVLDEEYVKIEREIEETKIKEAKRIEELRNEIEEEKKLINENEEKLLGAENRTVVLNQELDEVKSKLFEVNQEIKNLENVSQSQEKEFLEHSDKMKTLIEENQIVAKNTEEMEKKNEEVKMKIEEKQQELDSLKNPDLLEMQRKINDYEFETLQQKTQLEREIEEIESRNKTLQHKIECYQNDIKDLSTKKVQLDLERKESEAELKKITVSVDNMEKEIQRVEASKKEKVNLIQKPPLKRVVKQKKRPISVDVESDSSIDGERLTYAEFMKKKRMMHEKKQKK